LRIHSISRRAVLKSFTKTLEAALSKAYFVVETSIY
jgi:hypothetical protein